MLLIQRRVGRAGAGLAGDLIAQLVSLAKEENKIPMWPVAAGGEL
jgi:hypothetical protein